MVWGMADLQRMFIDGQWVEAYSGRTFTVTDPATGDAIGEVADGGAAETTRAIEAAQRAFPGWAARPAKERGAVLLRIQSLMEARRDDLARLVTRENGKPFEEARREVGFALGYFGWFAEEARRGYGDLVPSPFPDKRLWVIHQPVGVVGAITPWNFPATMVTRKIAPALAAGCPVVLKPASATPLTALALAAITAEAGLPAGVFNVVTGAKSRPIGDALVGHPLVRKIAFTGSTEVGKQLMQAAARSLKRVSFELGGNAPFVVFDDADLDAAVEGAVAIKFLRVGGQSCICANRLFVQDTVAEAFLPRFLAAVRRLRVGPGFEPDVVVGPLINEETRKQVHRLVEDAVAGGARVALGGRALDEGALARGYFYAPTVLLDVRDEMRVCREEIFGPVAPVLTFRTEAELIERANATEYGLAAYLYTRDLGRITRVAEALQYGLVGVNDAAGYTHEVPFGGFKESGLGREGGRAGLHEYMEVKSIVVNVPRAGS
jgi:succinate-semialdehyde dehydrogenase/glutarate-semialdehyde dehydrogenase